MKRILQLDGVRGVAIILVLIWHCFACQVVAEPKSILQYCIYTTSLTWSGVDLFFVLSGFLISGILLDNRDAPNYYKVFYLRRAFRILPLYFLLLTLFQCFVMVGIANMPAFQWLFHDPLPLWSYATFTQNIFMGVRGDFGPHWLGITWSLAVEEQFYLLIPLLIYLTPRRSLFLILLAAVLAAPLLRWISPGFHGYVNTPWRADSLLSGAALAVLVRCGFFIPLVQKNKLLLRVLFIILLSGAAFMTARPGYFGVFGHLWLAGLYSCLVLVAFADTEPFLVRILRSRVLVWFGQLSYGIYMLHEGMNGLLHGLFRNGPPQIRNLSDAFITVSAFGITLVLAALSFRFFERPFLRYGQRFQYSPTKSKLTD